MTRQTAGPAKPPVILIGLDAADRVLIDRWVTEGLLPGFQTLKEKAAWGVLESPARILQGSVWPSIATGCSPGKHGSYFRIQLANGTYRPMRMRADDVRRPPFWERLTEPDDTVVVIDVPKLPLRPESRATQVIEWGTVDHYSRFATQPADLKPWLTRRFGAHPLARPVREPRTAAAAVRLGEALSAAVGRKAALIDEMLKSRSPRLLFAVFGETHAAGHYLWRYMPSESSIVARDTAASHPLLDVYRAVDTVVAQLCERYSESANCIVFSGHGMRADNIPYGTLEELLVRMGMTRQLRLLPATGPRGGWGSVTKRLLRQVPRSVRRFANDHLLPEVLQDRLALAKVFAGIDFGETRAFALPSDHQGFVRLNLRGREPTGTVAPDDYDAVCDAVEADLLALRNPSDASPVVENVFRTRRVFPGADHTDRLPDLCVEWRMDSPVTEVVSPSYGSIRVMKPDLDRAANHRLDGFFYEWGPDIDSGAQGITGNALDIAPTVLALLGRERPASWDGSRLPIGVAMADESTSNGV
jgi:predicted AlkP superfamily phosphohydrolase/phosphomutase